MLCSYMGLDELEKIDLPPPSILKPSKKKILKKIIKR
jgi:hypothetical protein